MEMPSTVHERFKLYDVHLGSKPLQRSRSRVTIPELSYLAVGTARHDVVLKLCCLTHHSRILVRSPPIQEPLTLVSLTVVSKVRQAIWKLTSKVFFRYCNAAYFFSVEGGGIDKTKNAETRTTARGPSDFKLMYSNQVVTVDKRRFDFCTRDSRKWAEGFYSTVFFPRTCTTTTVV